MTQLRARRRRTYSVRRGAITTAVGIAAAAMVAVLAGCDALAPTGDDAPEARVRPRVVVTTDPELDDYNSLIRFLLYAPDFRIEGLIYASSQFHWKGDGKGTKWYVPGREYTRFGLDLCPCESWRWPEEERFIHDAVEAYAEVYDNLRVHHLGYPDPQELRSKIRIGNVEFDGDISRDSPGSNLIRSLLLDEGEGPIHLLAWGGQSTIARALKSIQEEFEGTADWPALHQKISRKAVIHAFGDQDDTYATYIGPNWPEIEFREVSTQTWGYSARSAVLREDQVYLSAEWTRDNVSRQGPLGALYRVWGDGKQMVPGDRFDYFGLAGDRTGEELRAMGYIVWMPVQEPGSWISEGDSPTFLNLLDNGLRADEDSAFGGWGGRAGVDIGPEGPSSQYPSARFFAVAQRDFAARLRWSVTERYEDANHPPEIRVRGGLDRRARPGEVLRIEGAASDPDGDRVSLRWWQYSDAGTYDGTVPLGPEGREVIIRIPDDARPGDTIHLVLEASDDGDPALTRYRRVIVVVAG
ncbi:MAG TPA: DUF1593 domain-containing protein [Longimicrobiaceae bacterium]